MRTKKKHNRFRGQHLKIKKMAKTLWTVTGKAKSGSNLLESACEVGQSTEKCWKL